MVFAILDINILISSYYGYLDQVVFCQSLLSKEYKTMLNIYMDWYSSEVTKRICILDDRSKIQYLFSVQEDNYGHSFVSKLYTQYYRFMIYISSR